MRLENFLSFRVVLVALVPAALLAGLGDAIWRPLGPVVGVVGWLVIYVLLAAATGTVLYCPHCRKRVKMGAAACHHCGRTVA